MLLDLLYVSAAFVGSAIALEAIGVPRAGPIVVLVALAVATWRLHAAGTRWSELGLRSPPSWNRVALWAVAAYALVIAANVLIVIPLARRWSWPPTDVAMLGDLAGNLPLVAGWLVIAWTTAAFGEELLFRGFLQSRLTAMLGGGPPGIVVAILVQAALFGAAHASFGIRGAVTAAMVAIVYGTIYAVNGRNLWPLIIAHGFTDSVSMVALYFGAAEHLA